MTHPATLVVHTPKGPEACCDRHAAEVRGSMFLLGKPAFTVPAGEGAECAICVHEAKTPEAA